MSKLDELDREIIKLLNQDGRMSNAEIARQIGDISARMVGYRIDNLVEQGAVHIRAIVNPVHLGYRVLADVLIETEPGWLMEAARKMATFEQVTYVACATGDRDISIQVVARSNEELFNFVVEDIANIPGVRRTQTTILPVKLKDIDRWLPPESQAEDAYKR